MQDVEDHEGGDDGAAPDHGAGGVGGGHVVLLIVGDGARGAILRNNCTDATMCRITASSRMERAVHSATSALLGLCRKAA
jgi:hypothetical protein